MNEVIWTNEIVTKLCGVMFRKALLDKNWTKIYERALVELMNGYFEGEMNLLKVLGDVGG